ncbi:MAG: bifunctional aldolase/short-chain dehydrogenase [Actinobacteria bacterium HGW-Actinobacteria-2]|nr:MAG: bifunctional aldolase/short-chain dehydrogenase [Actinobacteria bacterium HGW-Actinobacteria-2]
MSGSAVTAEAVNDLAELARVSRVIGSDPALVLHGGGNSSVKTTTTDITGEQVEVLYIKGSGHDLATITEAGFAPLRLKAVQRLLPPVVVPDDRLHSELRCALFDAGAPDPSVETLLHALLPSAAVLHSHADAVLALSNSIGGAQRVRDAVASTCVVVDYAMPGPDLVAACHLAWSQRHGDEYGIVVLGHGLFTGGDTPAEALERHLQVVALAEAALGPVGFPPPPAEPAEPVEPAQLAAFRGALCRQAQQALVLRRDDSAAVRTFLANPDALAASQAGPLTPDHASWTKPWPLIGRDLNQYASDYHAYFEANQHRRGAALRELDPAPRVILDAEFGLVAAGRTPSEAAATAEIYRHTMAAIQRANALGGYRPADREHVFDLEYWLFQQQKLVRTATAGDLTGQVALVTGAASGIGRGCAEQLLQAGACVVGWDLSASVADTFDSPRYLGLQLDVTDPQAVAAALARQVDTFGGLDILVVAAGIFPTSANLGELSAAAWRKTMAVNVDSVMELYGQARPLLAAGYPYGRVVLIASKNVAAPGPGAAAYSSSKAAVTQLTRVAALEWAGEGIRVNMVHPDAVFDTGLWTPELLQARAEHYGVSVETYKRRNLLHTEITSAAVGRLATQLCTESFACTTGAQIPIDGGNERVI